MFGLGPAEMVILGILAVLLFGKKLPSIARSVGSSVVEFKKGISGIEEVGESVDAAVSQNAKEIKRDLKSV